MSRTSKNGQTARSYNIKNYRRTIPKFWFAFTTLSSVGDIVYTQFGLKIRTRAIVLSTLHVECTIPNFKSKGPRLPWFISPTRLASSI